MTSDLQDIPDDQQLRFENDCLRAELAGAFAGSQALQDEIKRLRAYALAPFDDSLPTYRELVEQIAVGDAEVERLNHRAEELGNLLIESAKRVEIAEREVMRLRDEIDRQRREMTERHHLEHAGLRAQVESLANVITRHAELQPAPPIIIQNEDPVLRAECERLRTVLGSAQHEIADLTAKVELLRAIEAAAKDVVAAVTHDPEGVGGLTWSTEAQNAVERLVELMRKP